MALHAEAVRHGSLLAQHLHALRRTRHIDAAALLPAGGQSGLSLQRGIQLDAVLAHRRHVAVGPHLPDQAGGVPGGAAGELALLQQQHVGLAGFGQVVSGGTTGNAATDNDDFGMGGKGHGGVLLGWRIRKLWQLAQTVSSAMPVAQPVSNTTAQI